MGKLDDRDLDVLREMRRALSRSGSARALELVAEIDDVLLTRHCSHPPNARTPSGRCLACMAHPWP